MLALSPRPVPSSPRFFNAIVSRTLLLSGNRYPQTPSAVSPSTASASALGGYTNCEKACVSPCENWDGAEGWRRNWPGVSGGAAAVESSFTTPSARADPFGLINGVYTYSSLFGSFFGDWRCFLESCGPALASPYTPGHERIGPSPAVQI